MSARADTDREQESLEQIDSMLHELAPRWLLWLLVIVPVVGGVLAALTIPWRLQ